ncbi:hypothetical protein MHK_007418, partial [Candidatus Magnetomorum sp. HK-1]
EGVFYCNGWVIGIVCEVSSIITFALSLTAMG